DLKPNGKSEDSTEIAKIFQGMHLFIMESVTERKYVRPNLSEETITATRVSGFKNPQFASLATDFQPFSFYSNSIRLFDIQYLNPISDGSLTKYDFTFEDIHERGQDS